MDRRWILLIIILIIGIGCMHYIVSTSPEIGTAIASVDRVMVTLPDGFTNFQTDENSVSMESKYTHEKLFFKSSDRGDHAFEKYNHSLKEWKDDDTIKITNKSTMKIDNVTVYVICYQNSTSGQIKDYMRAYFYDFNTTFFITMWNFESYDKAESNLKYIVETLYPDYKKPAE